MTDPRINLAPYLDQLRQMESIQWTGRVTDMIGLLVESRGPACGVGDFCEIRTAGGRVVRTQVIGFRSGRILSMPLEETDGIQPGDCIIARNDDAQLEVGPELLGRVLDGFGRPMDGLGRPTPRARYPLYAAPPHALSRRHIVQPLTTGMRAVDAMLPIGRGQRMGIFGGSGVGKSTLLGSMAKHHSADISVIALIGERNREVRAFLDHELGPEGLKRSVVVVSTSDRPAPVRVRACFVALAVAEYFRDQGANVLLVMDSVTRLAMAQREIGLAAGEPPSQKGYTPSVFNLLPKIFERAGNFEKGSITGFFTVLVEGDDFNEPVCDSVRGILDGHIILSRELAAAGRYPAIDVLNSVSRLQSAISSSEQLQAVRKIREAMAVYHRAQDLIQLGAHVQGSNPKLDASIRIQDRIVEFLRQDAAHHAPVETTMKELAAIASML